MGVFKNDVGRPTNKTIRIRFVIRIIVILLLVGGIFGSVYFLNNKKTDEKITSQEKEVSSPYRLTNNDLNDFDLYFMQLENNEKNMVYSPLSIKYALGMLEEGANGETKEQISNIIGEYKSNKYVNSNNMSFANAMFIKDTFKDRVKSNYINNLKNKYNAEVVYDSFKTSDTVNKWVSNKTLNLINNLLDDAPNNDFMLVNALAIDMEWVNKIQSKDKDYSVYYLHRDFSAFVSELRSSGHTELKFKGLNDGVKALEIAAVANKYDIINDLGEENIRKTITEEYTEWINGDGKKYCDVDPTKITQNDINNYVDNFIDELSEGYKDISSSTDFTFYNGDDAKVFAKDLKTYNGITLQYIGIMPTKDNLKTYIENINAKKVNELIDNLKSIELDSFKDRVVTHITGYIPVFNYDYKLDLNNDLTKLGITNIFDPQKADLSNLSDGAYIDKTLHKATIDFSNDGIKASAVTVGGGKGDGACEFDHIYKMPVEKIDLTFDKPYIYLIRDKDSGEVWFAGSVYEPTKYTPDLYMNNNKK